MDYKPENKRKGKTTHSFGDLEDAIKRRENLISRTANSGLVQETQQLSADFMEYCQDLVKEAQTQRKRAYQLLNHYSSRATAEGNQRILSNINDGFAQVDNAFHRHLDYLVKLPEFLDSMVQLAEKKADSTGRYFPN